MGPVVTGADGEYDFTKLPTLPAGEHYTVTIDMTVAATVTALKPYAPTTEGQGTTATDSSTGSAESTDLTKDGDKDDTLDFGFYKEQVSVGDYVWVDQDHDGVQDAGEKGIPGITLVLTGPDGNPVTDIDGNLVAPVVTDTDGAYDFTKLPTLPAGEHYTVTIDQTASAEVLAPYVPTKTGQGTPATDSSTGSAESADLTKDGDKDDTLDFGFYEKKVSVGNYVWVDQDHDGVQDAGEKGIPGVTLVLTGPNGQPVTDVYGNPVAPVVTDADGAYDFTQLPVLPAGDHYTVTIDQTASAEVLAPYVPTKTGQGTPATDSSTGSAESIDLTTDGDTDDTLDFGFYKEQVSVGDYVWVDQDHDGVQDAGEKGIPGVTLVLTGPNGQPVTDIDGNPVGPVVTDANGAYDFTKLPVLPAGQHYTVTIDQTSPALAPYLQTKPNVGDTAKDSSTGSATSGDLTKHGDKDTTLDFGFYTPTPAIDIEKWSTVDGPLAGDFDNAPGRAIDGKPLSITFTITNTGEEPLSNVVVTDKTNQGPALTTISCDFSTVGGPTSGTTWSGPLAVGATFLCTGELPATTGGIQHSDTASVTGVGAVSGKAVNDQDDWHGHVATVSVAPPARAPKVDIEKWSTKDGLVAGDFDRGPGKGLAAKVKESISFTITNTGNDALVNVAVQDETLEGPSLTDVSCDFSPLGGPSTGTTWQGPLAVGASFNCSGVLPGLAAGDTHSNNASVTGVGQVSGTSVRDEDQWHGHVAKQAVKGTQQHGTQNGGQNNSQPENSAGPVVLPNTGGPSSAMPWGALAALLAGLLLIGLGRTSRRAHARLN